MRRFVTIEREKKFYDKILDRLEGGEEFEDGEGNPGDAKGLS